MNNYLYANNNLYSLLSRIDGMTTKPTAAQIIYLWGKEKIGTWDDCILCERKGVIVNHQSICVDHFVDNTYAQRELNGDLK